MKKYIIIILIFAIVSFSITGILIYLKNNNVEVLENIISLDKEENNKNSGEIVSTNNEKTIDLYGTFDENDIEIERLEKKYDGIEDTIEIPQIKGLKNKEIEEKVNKDIEKRIDEKIEEIKGKNVTEINDDNYNNENIYRGFSNVLSFEYVLRYNENEWEEVYFNYELVNGERLKFEDLFTKNADILSVIRRTFYKSMTETIDRWWYNYDAKKDIWTEISFDGDGSTVTEIDPPITEYDINKQINKFINNGEQEFYFTPSKLYIGENYEYIQFKDIADEVVIYDKYLTEESLYEKNNIGQDNFWTCTEVDLDDSLYKEYGFAEDNLFYDISLSKLTYIKNNYKNIPEEIINKIIRTAKDKIDEYKKISKENPDKFYILELTFFSDYNEENLYLINVNTEELIAFADISYKKDVIEKIMESYRYYNLVYYNYKALSFGIYGSDIGGPLEGYLEKYIKDENIKTEEYTKEYDIRTLGQYIIPESDIRKIEKFEIENLTLDELNKAYNEIFARHGHDFKNAELKEYFNSMSWYSAAPNKTVSLNELNEIEKYNLDIIKRVIDDKK